MAALERPSAISASTSRSRAVSRSSGSSWRPGQIVATTSGSSTVPPAATRRTASTNSRDVGDPVLEQVADRALAAGQQLAGVELLDVLRQHQHREARAAAARAAIAARSPSSVNVGGMPYVDDGDVGVGVAQRPVERRGVVDRRHDVEVVRLEQPDQAVPEEGVVFGEDNAHGTSSVTMVGPAAGLDTAHRAVKRRQPPHHPAHAGARVGVGAAGAVVTDDRAQHPVRRGTSSDPGVAGPGVLAELARHSATAK